MHTPHAHSTAYCLGHVRVALAMGAAARPTALHTQALKVGTGYSERRASWVMGQTRLSSSSAPLPSAGFSAGSRPGWSAAQAAAAAMPPTSAPSGRSQSGGGGGGGGGGRGCGRSRGRIGEDGEGLLPLCEALGRPSAASAYASVPGILASLQARTLEGEVSQGCVKLPMWETQQFSCVVTA